MATKYRIIITFFSFALSVFSYNIHANEANQNLNNKNIQDVDLTNSSEKKENIDVVKDVLSKINKQTNNKKKKKYKFNSIMFSNSELANLNRLLNSKDASRPKPIKKEEEPVEIATFGKIYLSSILYLSDNRWSIWVNGNKISSSNNLEGNDIFITSVNSREVELIWSLSPRKWRVISELPSSAKLPQLNDLGQIEIKVKLKSNQTYILKHDRVVNGKI